MTVRGTPSSRCRPLTSIVSGSSSGAAEPISNLICSAVRSPISRLWLRRMYVHDRFVERVARHAQRAAVDRARQRDDRDVGRAAADVDDHVAGRFGHGRPEPIAAAIGSSTRWTSLALTRNPLSLTARRSTCVISGGTPITSRGRRSGRLPCALRTKCISIFSAASKSAMTPSFIGRTGLMFAGVRPSISCASVPTASIAPLGGVERDDRGLVEHDAAPAREDAGVGRAEIDGDVGGEC